MKDIRIGNDISVRWSLYKGDEAYDLTNLPVTLYLKNAYGKKEIKDYTIEDNQISWTFFGKDQKNTGKYSMVLVVREGEQGMASTDYCDFVQLVSCACQVSGVDDENVQTETIELTSEVDFPPIIVDNTLSESSLNPIANKAVAEKFAEVEGKMALQPDWNQSDPISKDYIKNRTHGIVFHGDPRKSNYNDFLKSLTNPMIMQVGGNTIATFHTGYHSLYDYATFLFQLSWASITDNILDGIIPTNQSVSVSASTSVVLTFKTFGAVNEDGEFVEHYQTLISFNNSEGWNVDEVISALCEQYCLLINEDFEIAKLDQRYIPETIARESELLELSAEVGKKVDADKVATINGQSLINGGNIKIDTTTHEGGLIDGLVRLKFQYDADRRLYEAKVDVMNMSKIYQDFRFNGIGGTVRHLHEVDLYKPNNIILDADGAGNIIYGTLVFIDQESPEQEYVYYQISEEDWNYHIADSFYNDTDTTLLPVSEILIPESIARKEYVNERIEDIEVFVEDLQNTKIDKEADDYYPQLAVGLADNLSGVDVVDSEVNFRRSGGGAISDGVARIEAIKGNSVVWNQVYPTDWNKTYDGITSTSTNGKITSTGTTSTTFFRFEPFADNVENHKYLFMLVGATSALDGKRFGLLNRGNVAYTRISNGMAYVFYTNTDSASQKNIGIQDLTTGTEINESLYINQIDLTKAFPNDWQNINTIEEFYARKPMGIEDEYAYNEGEVIHMDVQAIESQGVNAWDEEWEVGQISSSTGENVGGASIRSANFIPVIGGEKYYFYCPQQIENMYAQVFFYDSDYNFIKTAGLYSPTSTNAANFNNPYIAPSNARYIRFYISVKYGTTYKNDICINISDTSINGKYFPYIKRVEDLSIIRKYFPQGMMKAGSAHDEIRYNKVTQKWEYSKGRFKSVDLGTLTYRQSDTSGGGVRFRTTIEMKRVESASIVGNILCSQYDTVAADDTYRNTRGIAVEKTDGISIFNADYTDAAALKASLQGVILYYESNDWEWVELDAEDQFKDLDYQVWNCGTEKAIAEGKSAPLAADITYGFNAIGKIKELESLVAALRAKVGI